MATVRPPCEFLLNRGNPITRHEVGSWVLGRPGKGLTRFDDLTRNNNGLSTGDDGSLVRSKSRYNHGVNVLGDPTNRRIALGTIGSSNPLSCAGAQQITFFAVLHLTLSGHGNDYARIIDKSSAGNAVGGYALYPDNVRGGVSLQIDGDLVTNGVNNINYTLPDKVVALCVTYDPSLGTAPMKVYQEGVLMGTASQTTALSSSSTPAAIGNWNHAIDRQYQQPIHLVRVFDKAFSRSEVATLFRDNYEGLAPNRRAPRVIGLAEAATGNPYYYYAQQ
jgi:hypothetical protein